MNTQTMGQQSPYQLYMQSRANQSAYNQLQHPQMQTFDNLQPVPYQQLGIKEVDGLSGVNRYPVAPGATVALKDIGSMHLFVKSVDLSGAQLPLRVFELNEVTQEYQDRETPVSRAEFTQLANTMQDLSGAVLGIRKLIEDLTAPSTDTAQNGSVP